MLPIQILLNNLLVDVSSVSLATDNVDKKEIQKPKSHNTKSLLIFSIALGGVSAIFDFIFFFFNTHDNPSSFQTKWFIFSTLTELAVLFSIRTKLPFYKGSLPSDLLMETAFFSLVVVFNLAIYGQDFLQISAIDVKDLIALTILTLIYFGVSEIVKIFILKEKRKY